MSFYGLLMLVVSESTKKYANVDIMLFKNIFIAMAIESKYISAFVRKNISILNRVMFVKKSGY